MSEENNTSSMEDNLGFELKDEFKSETSDNGSLKDEADSTNTEESEETKETEDASKESTETKNNTEDSTEEEEKKLQETEDNSEETRKDFGKTSEEEPQPTEDPKVEEETSEPVTFKELYDGFQEELKDKGVSYKDFLYITETDFDSDDVAEGEIISLAMQLEDPGVTEKEIDVLLDKYSVLFEDKEKIEEMLDNEEISQRELDILDAEFSRELRRARATISTKKEELSSLWDLEVGLSGQQSQQGGGVSEADRAAITELVKDSLSKNSKEVLSIKGKNGEEMAKVEIETSDEDMSRVIDRVSSDNSVYSRWVDESGQFDADKYSRDVFVLENLDKILAKTYTDGIAKGGKETVENIDNVDYTSKDSNANPGEKSLQDIMNETANRANI